VHNAQTPEKETFLASFSDSVKAGSECKSRDSASVSVSVRGEAVLV